MCPPGTVGAADPVRRDRLRRFVAPLMSCSARLPVYVFLTSMLFVGQPLYAAIAFAGCYLLGAVSALVSAAVLRRTLVTGTARPMVLELPSYKMPSFTNALISARDQGFAFLKTAGTIIMAISVVMWWLSAYPTADAAPAAVARRSRQPGRRTRPTRRRCSTRPTRPGQRTAATELAGRSGRSTSSFAPLGYDWQLTVGVLPVPRREVFVSTVGALAAATTDSRHRRDRAHPGGPAGRRLVLFTRRHRRARSSSLWECSARRRCGDQAATGSFKWAGAARLQVALAYVAALSTSRRLPRRRHTERGR